MKTTIDIKKCHTFARIKMANKVARKIEEDSRWKLAATVIPYKRRYAVKIHKTKIRYVNDEAFRDFVGYLEEWKW